jgi:dynein heavy chain
MKFDRTKYANYIETALPMEVPEMFGLHKNAEIGYLTQTAETLFAMIQQISGGSSGGSADGGKINDLIHLFLEKTPHPFASLDLAQRAAEKGRTPYVVVCLQESERMNILLNTIR